MISITIDPTDRREIAAVIDRLIEVLDVAAGDPDLEDDDPAGDMLDRGEGIPVLATLPKYGVDQSHGPLNQAEADRAHLMVILSEPDHIIRRRA